MTGATNVSPNPMLTTTPDVRPFAKRQSEAESTMHSRGTLAAFIILCTCARHRSRAPPRPCRLPRENGSATITA